MIRIIADGITTEAEHLNGLDLEKIFKEDDVDGVLVTYVVTRQPASRRVAPSNTSYQ